MYRDLISAKYGISSMGRDISTGGLPPTLEPLVFAFTGTNPDGNVCTGAREIFELLPHKYVAVEDLPELKMQKGPHSCVYGVLVKQQDMTTKIDGTSPNEWTHEDAEYYRAHPELYKPIFHETVGPYLNVLINGMYWDQRYPRLLTKHQIHDLYSRGHDNLLALADISCDIGGSVEFMSKSTSVESPYYHYDPLTDTVSDTVMKEGVAISAVDILPSELPRESSQVSPALHLFTPMHPHLFTYVCGSTSATPSSPTCRPSSAPTRPSPPTSSPAPPWPSPARSPPTSSILTSSRRTCSWASSPR